MTISCEVPLMESFIPSERETPAYDHGQLTGFTRGRREAVTPMSSTSEVTDVRGYGNLSSGIRPC